MSSWSWSEYRKSASEARRNREGRYRAPDGFYTDGEPYWVDWNAINEIEAYNNRSSSKIEIDQDLKVLPPVKKPFWWLEEGGLKKDWWPKQPDSKPSGPLSVAVSMATGAGGVYTFIDDLEMSYAYPTLDELNGELASRNVNPTAEGENLASADVDEPAPPNNNTNDMPRNPEPIKKAIELEDSVATDIIKDFAATWGLTNETAAAILASVGIGVGFGMGGAGFIANALAKAAQKAKELKDNKDKDNKASHEGGDNEENTPLPPDTGDNNTDTSPPVGEPPVEKPDKPGEETGVETTGVDTTPDTNEIGVPNNTGFNSRNPDPASNRTGVVHFLREGDRVNFLGD